MMSQTQPAQPEATKAKRRSARRGGPSGGAGSLLAQGEPMIWLTGGTLAVCLVMIVGLLLFIFITGFGTFWPQPIEKVELYNGQVVMGEPFRTQWFEPPAGFTDNLPEDVKQRVEDQITLNDGFTQRTLLYTGNFDLNNTRNEWVVDLQVKTLENPDWALTIERLKWGRFYGMPEKFVITTDRDITETERLLSKLEQYLKQRAPGSEHEMAFDPPAWAAIQPAMVSLSEKLAAIRSKSVQAFLGALPNQGEDEQIALLSNRQRKTVSQVEAADNVVAVLSIWNGSENAYRQFERFHPETVSNREQVRDMEKYDLGENTLRLEHARLDVRRAELNDGTQLLVPLSLARKIEIDERNPAIKRADALRELQQFILDEYAGTPIAEQTAQHVSLEIRNLEDNVIAPAQAEIDDYLAGIKDMPAASEQAVESFLQVRDQVNAANDEIRKKTLEITRQNERYSLMMKSAQGQDKDIPVAEIVRAYPANQLGTSGKLGVYVSRWYEFLTADPREANMEGGVFPAIVGTVLMTMIMCILVVPFGVLAALYLREYAKAGPIISAVRISINNLAGVPSIVFGVFGLGFFIYIVGAYIDGGPQNAFGTTLPRMQWWLGLIFTMFTSVCGGIMFAMSSARHPNQVLLRFIAMAATLLLGLGAAGLLIFMFTRADMLFVQFLALLGAIGLIALAVMGLQVGLTRGFDTKYIRNAIGWLSAGLLAVSFIGVVVLVALVPFFEGFFYVRLSENNPTFGKTALIWASFTLALLTLPVVIVATEEALSAVPNSMREGSYACGASKWQTIRRIVLPRALPGMMTGAILAMARGAGEVAPLMLVGAVKYTPELPIAFNLNPLDFFGASEEYGVSRSFMHLGFHIYDVGFQSPDSEAARPMVFTTTLLLILIVFVLNITAIFLRSRLRRRFQGSAF